MKLSQRHMERQSRASSALVIVLFAVVLVTIMILALMTGAKFERQSAFYYKERIRADALAQSGIEHAIGLLRTGMGGNTNGWISAPGQIVPVTYNNNTSTVGSPISLSSGTNVTTPTGIFAPANLNAELLDGTYPLDGAGEAMSVRWIYVRRDGTLDSSDTPATSAANPLVGRYAFWVDDSSSRLNLNTAYQRANNTNAISDVSRIDLVSDPNFSSGTVAGDTHYYATNNPFNSDYDLRSNDIYSAVSPTRYTYTAYNHSSDGLNPFGKPKIYLTTQMAYLPPGFTNVPGYSSYYINILKNDTGDPNNPQNDPGMVTNVVDAKIGAVVNNIYTYLTNTTWPEHPGTSFASKYWGSNSDPRIFQLAVNIVEYVRAKESRQEIVNAIKGNVSGGVFTSLTYTDGTSTGVNDAELPGPLPILGVTRTPIIDEFGICWYRGPDKPYSLQMELELYLPPGCGITSLFPGDFELFGDYIDNNSPLPTQSWDNNTGIKPGSTTTWGAGASGGAGSYCAMSGPFCPGNHFSATVPISATNRYGVVITGFNNNGLYYDTTKTNTFYGFAAVNPYDPNDNAPSNRYGISSCLPSGTGGMAGNGILGKQLGPFILYPTNNGPLQNSFQLVDDPLDGGPTNNWQWLPSTWGSKNGTPFTGGLSPGSYPASPPQQDTDSSGLIATNGWRMPAPYMFPCTNYSTSGITVTTNNMVGRMESLAELGYVSTGAVWMTNSPTGSAGVNGVPWRTLRLQPSNTSTTLPDWALLDLFALPPANTNFAWQPYAYTATSLTNGGASGGRVNINGSLYPFTGNVRIAPLMAMLHGATNPIAGGPLNIAGDPNGGNNLGEIGALATNVLTMQMAGNGRYFDSTNGYYAHVGELAEIEGMADGGESSEGNLFEPLAQTTVNGNVFTVYTIGQALQQTSTGGLLVNGEKKYQATVERNPTVSATASSGMFHIVNVRELSP